ncbi:MAG: hypothetical protein ACXABO_19775 [Promethearchaeota archaeon]|jgi:hypothetical protein
MKKKRTISIRDPRLRRVRYELRRLLQLAKSDEIHGILEKKRALYEIEGFWDNHHPAYKKLHEKVQFLNSQEDNLRYTYKASIAICPVCSEADKDMTYNPVLGEWFCTECYKSNQEFEASRGHPELYP